MSKKIISRFYFLILFFFSLILFSNADIWVLNETTWAQTSLSENETANEAVDINDGPYIFIKKDSLIEKHIVNGEVINKSRPLKSRQLRFNPEPSIYENVKKIAAFSDIHGQYDLAIKILKNNKIINKKLKWSFGKGHLVIVGDIFDRGNKTTEMLWFIYNLEKQAKKRGGRVHYLLGNHEYMVMQGNLRYIGKKYKRVSELMKMPYDELYNKQTMLGRWLRSKATIIKINDKLFVHGGISEEFISQGFDLNEINKLMRESIDKYGKKVKSDPFYKKYYGDNGPIWYRGYLLGNLKENTIDKILSELNVNHIIVGHTSLKQIKQFYNQKVFIVDSSIKRGEYGEILLIKKNKFFRGMPKGKKVRLD